MGVRLRIPFMREKVHEESQGSQANGRLEDRQAIPLTKILVVDDDQVILKTVRRKLEGVGYRVATALDGSEAIAAVRTENPDLILLDITFPPDVAGVPWDGFRVMEWLHHMEGPKKIPVIIITGGQEVQNRERALAAGAVAFFNKPIDHDDLIHVIHATLSHSKAPIS
jgi:two-component system OmpR family response regulator